MLISYKRGQGSIVIRVKILDSAASTGAGKTGLTSASSGLIISTIADNEASATAYTVAGSTIETITTLGTFAAPTATKCRFKEVDSTNHKGIYELQIADARYAVSSAKSLLVSIAGPTGAAETDACIPLTDFNPYDAVRGGFTALPNAAAEAAGGLYTRGTGAGQISQANNGQIDANAARTGGTTNTGRDIGASVLLSPGTGTGQLSLTSGAVLLQATQSGVTIPTVTTLTNAPSDSSGVTTLLSRVPSGIFTGITSLAQWLGLLAGKQTGNSTARTEVRATGGGSGTYDETTDSQEALSDTVLKPATAGRTLVVDGSGLADANTVKVGPTGSGTAQTARDIGASVLLSSGTGTGQLDFASGVVKANLVQILASAITGTAAQLVAAFTKFFNVATPTGTVNSLPDAVPDASGGLPVTGNRLTAIPVVAHVTLVDTTTTLTNAPADSSGVTSLLSRLPAGLFTGLTNFAHWLGAIAGKQAANSTAQTEMRASGAGSGTFDPTTDSQEAIRDNMGTAQTGDSYARLGAPAGASVSADVLAVKNQVAAIEVDTQDIQSRIPAALNGDGYIKADAKADFTGAVVTDGGNSASSFKTDLTQTADDHWKESYIRFTSGDLTGQVRFITAYDGTAKIVTTDAFTDTPADGDAFDVINE